MPPTSWSTLGPWSPQLLQQVRLPHPAGAQARLPHALSAAAARSTCRWSTPPIGYAMAPMAKGIRITTGAELTRPDALGDADPARPAPKPPRGELIEIGSARRARALVRHPPCTPDMLPVLGPVPRHRGLWVNFGHGHQGFTLGPATGAAARRNDERRGIRGGHLAVSDRSLLTREVSSIRRQRRLHVGRIDLPGEIGVELVAIELAPPTRRRSRRRRRCRTDWSARGTRS